MNKASIRAVLHVSALPALERGYDYREKRTSATINSKTAVDGILTDDEIGESALRHFLRDEKDEEIESSIFLFINWNTTKQVFFDQSSEQNRKAEKSITYLFEEVMHRLKHLQNGISPILLKVTQLQTEQIVIGKVQDLDQNGFLPLQSVQKASIILSKCSQKYSQSALAITINQGRLSFRCIYFPLAKKQLCSDIFNNFQSQKSLILSQFEGSPPSRFCIFWSIDKVFIAEVSQHLLILRSGKDDKTLLENAKKEVHRLEGTYKKLNEKHRKILGILSKCIDLESAQIDKKNLLYVDYLPSSEKPNDKLRISAIRKAENDEEIDRLQAEVTLVEGQITEIKESHKVRMQEQENLLIKCEEKKTKLWKNYQSCLNPRVKLEHTNSHNIYWRPISKPSPDGSQSYQDVHNMQSLNSITKNNIISHKNLSRKAVDLKQTANQSKKGIKFSSNIDSSLIFQQQRFNKGEMIREIELKAEIKQLFELISRQQKVIQAIYEKENPNLKGSLINQMKNRKKERVFNECIIKQCLLEDCQKSVYQQWVKQQSNHLRFQRELRQKQLAAQTLTTIKQI